MVDTPNGAGFLTGIYTALRGAWRRARPRLSRSFRSSWWRARTTWRPLLRPTDNSIPAFLLALLCLDLGARLPPFLRACIVLPVALILPGAALAFATLGSHLSLRGAPRVTLWIMLSMALYPALALALQISAYPLNAHTALAATNLLVLLLLATGALRTALSTPPAARSDAADPGMLNGAGAPAGPDAMRLLVLLLPLLLVVAGGVAFLPKPPSAQFSQVSLDGAWAHLDAVAVEHGSLSVTIRIANHTAGTRAYRIMPMIDLDGGWPTTRVTIRAGREWSGALHGAVPSDDRLHRLRIAVYSGGRAPIAALTLWIRRCAPPACACPSVSGQPPLVSVRCAAPPSSSPMQPADGDQVPR